MRSPQRALDVPETIILSPTPVDSLEDLTTMASQLAYLIHTPTREWMIAILLNAQQIPIASPYLIYQGRRCPIGDFVSNESCFVYARGHEASSLIMVRYHPHPMTLLTDERLRRFQQLHREAKGQGIPIRHHVTFDSQGDLISWKHWGQPGGSGVTSFKVPAARFCNSMP